MDRSIIIDFLCLILLFKSSDNPAVEAEKCNNWRLYTLNCIVRNILLSKKCLTGTWYPLISKGYTAYVLKKSLHSLSPKVALFCNLTVKWQPLEKALRGTQIHSTARVTRPGSARPASQAATSGSQGSPYRLHCRFYCFYYSGNRFFDFCIFKFWIEKYQLPLPVSIAG